MGGVGHVRLLRLRKHNSTVHGSGVQGEHRIHARVTHCWQGKRTEIGDGASDYIRANELRLSSLAPNAFGKGWTASVTRPCTIDASYSELDPTAPARPLDARTIPVQHLVAFLARASASFRPALAAPRINVH